MLPQLTELLEALRAQAKQLAALQGQSGELNDLVKRNGHHNPAADNMTHSLSQRLQDEIRAGVERLAQWDIELKDLATGLVDFPAHRRGHTVFLCWKLGEPEVAFWHDTDAGFAGRQPLDDGLS